MAYSANTNWDNERKYLNNLVSQGGGNGEWAKNQLNELSKAQQQYGASSGGNSGGSASRQPSAEETANRYFPNSSGNGNADKTPASPSGGTPPLYDWASDTTDYGQLMLDAKNINEFREAAQARVNKANAQGIDIYGGSGIRSNEDLYNEWKKKTGYDPKYGDFVSRGYGLNQSTGEVGWVNNLFQNTGYYGMDGEGHWGYYEDPELTKKMERGTWDDYASSDGGYVRMDNRGQPDMTVQDTSRAGQTVVLTGPKGTWRVTYSENGYPIASVRTSTKYTPGLTPAKADNNAGVSSEELMNALFGHSYTGPGSTINDKDITAATRSDYEAVMASRGANQNTGAGAAQPNTGNVEDDSSGSMSTGISAGTGGSTGSGGYDLSEWLKKQYESSLEGELAGLKDAYEKNSASLDDEEARLSGIYDPQRNRVAAQNALAKRVWDERAAANGLSSGANGQAELARSSAMQRDLASIGEEEANARADVSLRKQNLTIEYTNAIAQAKANGQSELAKALYNELVRVQGLEREDQIRASENALKQAQAQMEYELALKQMETDSSAASQETAKPGLTASQAYTAYKNGIRTNEVMEAMRYYYGIGNGTSGTGGTSSGTGGTTGTASTTPGEAGSTNHGKTGYDNGGLTSSQIKQMQQDLNKYLPAGQKISVDGYWGPATKAAAGGATAQDYYRSWQNQKQTESGLLNKQERM